LAIEGVGWQTFPQPALEICSFQLRHDIGLVWPGLAWFGLAWFGLAWFGFGLAWFSLV
jgi:hypothetical protein